MPPPSRRAAPVRPPGQQPGPEGNMTMGQPLISGSAGGRSAERRQRRAEAGSKKSVGGLNGDQAPGHRQQPGTPLTAVSLTDSATAAAGALHSPPLRAGMPSFPSPAPLPTSRKITGPSCRLMDDHEAIRWSAHRQHEARRGLSSAFLHGAQTTPAVVAAPAKFISDYLGRLRPPTPVPRGPGTLVGS